MLQGVSLQADDDLNAFFLEFYRGGFLLNTFPNLFRSLSYVYASDEDA